MQDLNDKVTGGNLTASEWNEVPSELQNIIEKTGQTLSGADLDQLGKGVANYVANSQHYTDSGAANAYVLTAIGTKQSPTAYVDGMMVEFVPANTNTTSSTVNVAGLGVKNITGTSAGGTIESGIRLTLRYNSSSGEFEIYITARAASTENFTTIVKAADESVNNSATLQDDDHFLFTVSANSVYRIEGALIFQKGNAAGPDAKIDFVEPSGFFSIALQELTTNANGQTATNANSNGGGSQTIGLVSSTTEKKYALLSGILEVGGTGGTFKLQWAQATANASDTFLRAGSWMKLTKYV